MIKKMEMQEYARLGVRMHLEEIERQLAGLHRQFPDLFLGDTAPIFLRPEPKPNGTSTWPTVQVSAPEVVGTNGGHGTNPSKASVSQKASWTPARRAKQAKMMKKRSLAMHAAKAQRHAKLGATEPWGYFVWQRMHDFLQTQDQRTAKVQDIMREAKVNVGASVASAIKNHPEYFKRVGVGRYQLKKVYQPKKVKGEAAAAAAE